MLGERRAARRVTAGEDAFGVAGRGRRLAAAVVRFLEAGRRRSGRGELAADLATAESAGMGVDGRLGE